MDWHCWKAMIQVFSDEKWIEIWSNDGLLSFGDPLWGHPPRNLFFLTSRRFLRVQGWIHLTAVLHYFSLRNNPPEHSCGSSEPYIPQISSCMRPLSWIILINLPDHSRCLAADVCMLWEQHKLLVELNTNCWRLGVVQRCFRCSLVLWRLIYCKYPFGGLAIFVEEITYLCSALAMSVFDFHAHKVSVSTSDFG